MSGFITVYPQSLPTIDAVYIQWAAQSLYTVDEWEAPLGSEAFRPEPLGSHAFSKFDSHRAVLFGGNNTLVYSNTCYLFDLDTRVS